MRRNLLGIVAAILLMMGVISMVSGPGGESARQFSGVCIRSGLVLGALWLALPQIISLVANSPRWLMSWLFGKGKPASSSTSPSSTSPPARSPSAGTAQSQRPVERASQPEQRQPPPPRPRRRSNS